MFSHKRIHFQFLIIISVLGLLIFAQGCTPEHDPGFSNLSPSEALGWAADEQLQTQALQIVQTACASCHGDSTAFGGVERITNVLHLIQTRLIVPADSTKGRLIGSIEDGTMPPGGSVSADQLAVLKSWIDSFTQTEGGGLIQDPPPPSIPLEPTFKSIQANILIPKCVGCHRVGGERPQENYETYELALSTGGITPGDVEDSEMYDECESGDMPLQPFTPLNQEELQTLADWINQGALNN